MLWRKLLRDLRGMKGQSLAIMALVGSGVAVYLATSSTHSSLARSRELYYTTQGFAHLFAPLRRAPENVVREIADLPGVAEAEGRIVADVNLSLPGFVEPVTGHLVSIPETPARLNRLRLIRGSMPESHADDDVLVNDGFAKAHRLEPGAHLEAIINGRRRQLRMVGVALSPEFIYPIRPGDMIPDDSHYGIVWMGARGLAASLQMTGAVNEIAARLDGSAPAAQVRAHIDRVLARHGGTGAYGREDHDSHRFLSDDMRQLENMATVLPPIFFGVAAFLISIVLSRLVALQRTEIGTLKAMGFSNAAVGLHYAMLALVLVAAGSVVGTALGAGLGANLTEFYAGFYRLPALDYQMPPRLVVEAVLLGVAVSALSVLVGVSRAMRLAPAVAMRPEPPPTYQATWIERLGLLRRLGPAARMVVRHLLRRLRRTFITAVGLGAALAIVLVSLYFGDGMEALVDLQFQTSQREDMTVTFSEPMPREVLHDLGRLPGVQQIEGFRQVPALLRSGPRVRRLGILAVPAQPALRQILDGQRAVSLPARGLTMSAVLARQLGVQPGDQLTVEVLEGHRRVLHVPVLALVEDWTGIAATMDEDTLDQTMGEPAGLSGALLKVDPLAERDLYRALKEQPRVTGVTLKRVMIAMFRETSAQFVLVFSFVLVGFALVITAGVLYNAGRVSFAERQRELATLRVLGMTRQEAWLVLAGELAIQLALGVPTGLLMGAGLIAMVVRLMSSDLYRLPLILLPRTFALGALLLLAGGLVVILLVRRWVRSLDLVGVLKTRE